MSGSDNATSAALSSKCGCTPMIGVHSRATSSDSTNAVPTDFREWDRATLERFARECADENLALREELALALAAWRQEVLRNRPQAVSCGTQPPGEGS